MSEEFTDPGPFNVGDVVKIVKTYTHHNMRGTVVTIMGPLQMIRVNGEWEMGHLTDQKLGERPVYVMPDQIRRRKPPTTGEETCMSWFVVTPQREKAPA